MPSLPMGRKCFHSLVLVSLHAALIIKPVPSDEHRAPQGLSLSRKGELRACLAPPSLLNGP